MILTILSVVEWILFGIVAFSCLYVIFFAFISVFPAKNQDNRPRPDTIHHHSFLVLFPAYAEDKVIIKSVTSFLNQDYPHDLFSVVVISDHMMPETNSTLSSLPVTLLCPDFSNSSKAKALQYAVEKTHSHYDYILILDADNIVQSHFLSSLNVICSDGFKAIQCHRKAKNEENGIAILDGLSEEINNTIFRKAHNIVGLSSALIGSGMCFDYIWFSQHVNKLSTNVEDREIESFLLLEKIHIHYAEHLDVLDEKVSSADNFQHQRQRWMSGQFQAFCRMIRHIPYAVLHTNLDYIDKTLQQILIPRSILIAFLPLMAIILSPVSLQRSLRWCVLFALFSLSLTAAVPKQLRTFSSLRSLFSLPPLLWRMVVNLTRLNNSDKTFLHTNHSK